MRRPLTRDLRGRAGACESEIGERRLATTSLATTKGCLSLCDSMYHQQEWIRLGSGKEFSRLLYPNPVCFLTALCDTADGEYGERADEAKEGDDGGEDCDDESIVQASVLGVGTSEGRRSPMATSTPTKPSPTKRRPPARRSVMVLSWLSPANNDGRFMLSIKRSRYTASILAPPRRGEDGSGSKSPFRTGVEFVLSVPVRGMERRVLEVGSVSGRFGSKFPKTRSSSDGTDAASPAGAVPAEPSRMERGLMSNRQRKRLKMHRLAALGVEGLRPVPVGRYASAFGEEDLDDDDLFAVEGTVAHLRCRTRNVMGRCGECDGEEVTMTQAMSLTPNEGDDEEGASGKRKRQRADVGSPAGVGDHNGQEDDVIDETHLLLLADVVEAHVHPSYWDSDKLLFRPRSKDVAPYLTFFGSQTFGFVVAQS